MAAAQAIPVLAYGRQAGMATAMKNKLAPEYDGTYKISPSVRDPSLMLCWLVVHVCLTDEAAKSEAPKLISGDLSVEPTSGLGSNVQRKVEDRLIPKAVLCGGGYGHMPHHPQWT
jgi:hypothetical protein